MIEASKEAFATILAYPEIRLCYDGVAPELKPSTRQLYLIYLMRYFGKDSPSIFLKKAQEHPREAALETKT